MINPNYNITDLKTALYTAFFKTEVSKNVFMARPATTDKITDFVVIRIIAPVKDNWATGKTACRVELYAKDKYNAEDATKSSEMFLKSITAVGYLNANHNKYIFQANDPTDRGSDGLGFHCTSIDLIITINN